MTIINHTYRFAFVHIPKTGGSSVAQMLSQLSTYRDQEIGVTPIGAAVQPHFRARFGIGKHSTAAEIRKVVGSDTFESYVTFTIVRNPFDRLISCYNFLRRWSAWRELSAFAKFVPEFDECVSVNDFVASSLFETPGPDRLFNRQTFWTCDAGSDELIVDYVLKLETIGSDLRRLLGRLGAPGALVASEIPAVNVSPGTQAALNPSAIDAIRARYATDFKVFDYDDAAVPTALAPP